MKTELKTLKTLLDYEENDPFKLMKIKLPDSFSSDFCFVLGTYYCCERNKDKREVIKKKLLARIKKVDATIIKLKYPKSIKKAFEIEMYWINQTYSRITLFNDICKEIEKKIAEMPDVELNVAAIIKKLPINDFEIELQSLNKLQVLDYLAKGKIKKEKALNLISIIEKRESDKLCQFSGVGFLSTGQKICSRTNDPKRIGDCSTCRVAAEWEEAYG